jgi:uncharacterized protein YbaR (Trm112 family)
LKILACPKCKKDIIYKNNYFICKKCRLKYKIKNNVPDMLIKNAEKI